MDPLTTIAHTRITRREFAQGAAAALVVPSILPRHVVGADAATGQGPPSETLRLAGIGVGGVGYGQVQACERAGFQVAALCDVDDRYARKAYDRWPNARRYRDFRELLDAEGPRIDAVYIGTPDHTHAIIAAAALRKKKHVCCVKPLTRTIHECRVLVETARAAGVATQVTASPNTSDRACRTCELIAAGAIGGVREVHIWSNRPVWPQGMLRPDGEDPVPANLDWKLWLGPAPFRPFKESWPPGHYAVEQVKAWRGRKDKPRAVYHPFNFRGWWAFGTGALGDMGCHHLNTPFRALKLTHPARVEASATMVSDEAAPLASIVTYDFPARGEMPPVRVVWYDGGLKPPCPPHLGARRLPDEGTLYVGDAGAMFEAAVLPEARAAKFTDVPRSLPRRPGTWGEWFQACKGGEPAGCDFAWAGLLTEFVLLGNIAIRTGKALEWNGASGSITNDAGASGLLREQYHNGWSLES